MKKTKTFILESFTELDNVSTVCSTVLSVCGCVHCKYYGDCITKGAVWMFGGITAPSPVVLKNKFLEGNL